MQKFISILLCVVFLFSLALPSLAADEVTPTVSISSVIYANGTSFNYTWVINSSSTSAGKDTAAWGGVRSIKYTSGNVVVNSNSVTTFNIYPVSSNFTVSTSASGFSVAYSISNATATVSVTANSDRTSNQCPLSFTPTYEWGWKSSELPSGETFGISSYSYVSSGGGSGGESGGGGEPEPEKPAGYYGGGGMNGWTGEATKNTSFSTSMSWNIYNSYIGEGEYKSTIEVPVLGSDGLSTGESEVVTASNDVWVTRFLCCLVSSSWSWDYKATWNDATESWVKDKTQIVFNVPAEASGGWADMLYRTSVWNYVWNQRLMSNSDLGGSWFSSISSDFAYLNFRVNQIFDVLANDEDLAIKNATDEERQWVQDYFNGSKGDFADSSKYDDLDSTGDAISDLFGGADVSGGVGSALTDIQSSDNGFSFWSDSIKQQINGVSSSARDVVPPEQRIVDFYSDNWERMSGYSD